MNVPVQAYRSFRQRVGLILGVVSFLVLLNVNLESGAPQISRMAAVAALMAVWWMTEAIPIPATALIPLVAFPLLGIMSGRDTSKEFINQYIFLFMGGFMLALALKKWDLHKRIALTIISWIGFAPKRVVLGFMAASGFLSMWISNTATTMMMLPIGLSVVSLFESAGKSHDASENPHSRYFPVCLMLGIAYGASIGGVATLVGTPPNLSFARIYAIQFPAAKAISFQEWLFMALPLSIVFMLIAWFILVRFMFPIPGGGFLNSADIIRMEKKNLGRLTAVERRVGFIFFMTALLWIFRKDLVFGSLLSIPGWTSLLDTLLLTLGVSGINLGKFVDDGTIAVFGALLLFIIPSGRGNGEKLIDWDTAAKLPWGILLLFGGGFAMAKGFGVTGLSLWVGKQLSFLGGISQISLVALVSGTVTFLTELTSNTATTEMILPVIAGVAREVQINPLLLMVPATLSASCAFMLPVATPPNAIIFGSGYVSINDMIKAGIVLNLTGIILISLLMFTWGAVVMGV